MKVEGEDVVVDDVGNKEEKKKNNSSSSSNDSSGATHALVLAYPVQGHINPMIQFSKRLESKGTKVTFLTPTSSSKSLHVNSGSIDVTPISDGSEDGVQGEELSVKAKLDRMRSGVTRSLTDFLQSQGYLKRPAQVLVYDSFMPWVMDIAEQHGLNGAPFFTQSCVVCAAYYLVQKGAVRIPLEKGDPVLIGDPPVMILGPEDLPSFMSDVNVYPDITKLVVSQFSSLRRARWALLNSFVELEEEVVKWISREWPVLTIGPAIPSMFLDKRLKDDNDYSLNLFKPELEASTKWLDSKEAGSVVYISFGSLAALGEEQMGEIANGLKRIKSNFLWVVRETEQKKLPPGLVDEVSGKGLIVRWCHQLQVLSHKSVGCFVTHCGWNSTLEALSLGVPMVVMPQWTDQPTNAKFIVDVWKAGVRIGRNEKGVVTAEAIEACINEIMVEEKGREIRERSMKWEELAQNALKEGGSSDANISKFVAELKTDEARSGSSRIGTTILQSSV